MTTGHHLLAVMRDAESARRVVDDLTAHGLDGASIQVDEARDESDALRAEMAAETTDSVMSPQGVFIASKEGARGTVLFTVVGSVVALLVCIPVAMIDVGLTYWARYAIEAGFLVLMVFLIGYVLGGAWAWNPEEQMAAERGVVVRVPASTPELAQIIIEADPIRLDEVTADGRPVAIIHTDGVTADSHLAPKVSDTVHHVRDAVEEQRGADPTERRADP